MSEAATGMLLQSVTELTIFHHAHSLRRNAVLFEVERSQHSSANQAPEASSDGCCAHRIL